MMENSGRLKAIFGGGVYGNSPFSPELSKDEAVLESFAILKSHGITDIDTAQAYPGSEAALGKYKAVSEHGFTISTKWACGVSEELPATYDNIVTSAQESLRSLGVKKVDVFFLHLPDMHIPFEETLKGVNEVYRMGAFERFGLSNFTPRQVKQIVEICKKNNYVPPKVYQGNYSAASRLPEDKLLPLLREHGISYFAYSPAAGGFLTKTRQYVEDSQGRFNPQIAWGAYSAMYGKPSYLNFLEEWAKVAQDEGVSKIELAYRWMNHHSALKPKYGDAMIFGASTLKQTEESCKYLEAGPLTDRAVKRINDLWDTVKNDAVIDVFQVKEGKTE